MASLIINLPLVLFYLQMLPAASTGRDRQISWWVWFISKVTLVHLPNYLKSFLLYFWRRIFRVKIRPIQLFQTVSSCFWMFTVSVAWPVLKIWVEMHPVQRPILFWPTKPSSPPTSISIRRELAQLWCVSWCNSHAVFWPAGWAFLNTSLPHKLPHARSQLTSGSQTFPRGIPGSLEKSIHRNLVYLQRWTVNWGSVVISHCSRHSIQVALVHWLAPSTINSVSIFQSVLLYNHLLWYLKIDWNQFIIKFLSNHDMVW